MDPEKWGILLNVIKCGSLSKAAEQLGYTPSGISRAIASLEEEVGFPLLTRDRRGVSPTKECTSLMPHVQRLCAAAARLHEEASSLCGLETGTLTIGSSYGNYYHMLAEWVSSFRRLHPGITVEILKDVSSSLARAVEDGRCDLCVISRREGRFEWIPLTEDDLVAVLPADHPSASLEAYPIADLAGEAFIDIMPGQETDNTILFSDSRLKPRNLIACADTFAALSMVEAGLGVTLVNGILLSRWQGNVAVKKLDPPRRIEIGIACPAPEECSPAARQFLAHVHGALAGTR